MQNRVVEHINGTFSEKVPCMLSNGKLSKKKKKNIINSRIIMAEGGMDRYYKSSYSWGRNGLLL